MGPRWKHDCEACVFRGHFDYFNDGEEVLGDIYTCENDGHVSIICRMSDEPSNYSSRSVGLKGIEEVGSKCFSHAGRTTDAVAVLAITSMALGDRSRFPESKEAGCDTEISNLLR